MEIKRCKECGEKINKKAEICPHCGCRIKSNTLKIVVICLMVIFAIAGLLLGAIVIKHGIDDSKQKKEEKIIAEETEKLTKLLKSYIGKYSVKYDKELFGKEHPLFELKESFSIDNQCYKKDVYGQVQDGDIVDDCITMENSEVIPYIHNNYVLYNDNGKYTFYFTLGRLISANYAQDASNETMKELELYEYYLCFEGDANNLKQIDCPKKYFENRQPNDTLDSKYNFEIIKEE